MVNHYPRTIAEAIEALREPHAVPVAGATDWMLRHSAQDVPIFLYGIESLARIQEAEGGVRIGAACTHAQLMDDPRVPQMLREACAGIAAPAVRNLATLGGNLCNASPAGDTLPVLYAADARARLEGPDGARELPISEMILGPRRTALKKGELLTEVFLPRCDGLWRVEKVGGRRAQAISKCSMAAWICLRDGRVERFRAAFGAVGATVVQCREGEALLLGAPKAEIPARAVAVLEAFAAAISPIDDQRSTAEYRRDVCLRLLGDFLREAAA